MPDLAVNPHNLPSLPLVAARPSISTASSPSVSLCAESYAAPSQSTHSTASSAAGPTSSNPHTPTHASPHQHHLHHSPHGSVSPRRIASKAADLLYGGHKSDGHGKKVYDLLGMTAKQYEKVQQQQQHQHHDAAETKEESKEATDILKPIEPIAAAANGGGGHRRQNSRVVGQSKAMDLLYGGHKADSKVGDMLGVSKQEIEHFKESQKAYQKLGVGSTPATHDILPRDMHVHTASQQQQQTPTAGSHSTTSGTSPASTNTHLVLTSPTSDSHSSLSSLSIANQHGNRRASISKKASDLLYGSNKSNSKVEDRLGVMEKELETFGRIPKAYQVMGVYDHREVSAANKQLALAQTHPQSKVAAGQLLSPPQMARAEMSVSNTPSMQDRLVSLNRPVSLSMVPISPLSTFTALPTIPLSPARMSHNSASQALNSASRNKHSLNIPPLGSSRPSSGGSSSRSLSARSDSDGSTSAASMAVSPRSRKVILQPLPGTAAKGLTAGQWGPMSPSSNKLSEVVEERDDAGTGALSAAARVRARERASRLKSKVKVAVALSSWQQSANQASKTAGRTSSTSANDRVPRTPSHAAASSAVLFAPTATALQLGVSGRSLNKPAPVTSTSEGERVDESTIVSALSIPPSMSPSGQLAPQAIRALPAKPARRPQLSPVKVNRRSLLPGAVGEELQQVLMAGGVVGAGGGGGTKKRWGKVGAAVHVAAAMRSGTGLSGAVGGGLGSPMRGRGETGFPAGKSTVYVAANYKV